jgi:hypothetical protein
VWGFVEDEVALGPVLSEHCILILSVLIHQSSVILMADSGPIRAALSQQHYTLNPPR